VLGISPREINLPELEEAKLSTLQLKEEATEFLDAVNDGLLGYAVDAIVDSIYFSYGILYKMGVSEEKMDRIFSIVHEANMKKQIGIKKGREGFDALDAVKPEGWEAPEEQIEMVLADA